MILIIAMYLFEYIKFLTCVLSLALMGLTFIEGINLKYIFKIIAVFININILLSLPLIPIFIYEITNFYNIYEMSDTFNFIEYIIIILIISTSLKFIEKKEKKEKREE
ncbi:hypothetical protein [Streptobacillus ratti]|uniref:hypothetical protein n=1 Tax=Streptobacillus ratti TaxID=1720557 RepID=UPI000933D2F2|nr:hypothetical protein [Streptobacillus ratti]